MDESSEEIDLMSSGKLGNNKENPIGINGSDEGVKEGGGDEVTPVEKPKDDPITESGNSPSSIGTTKGKGLRKWRRIRREVVKDGSGSIDSSKAGKRGLSTSASNPSRGHKSDGSLSSTGAVVRNIGNSVNGPRLDSKVVVASADSEKSEDGSSISSTVASSPAYRNGELAMMARMSEKKGVNGVQQGKAWVKNTKKARGVRVKIEKENSISSLESDSRSSNFVFVQGGDSVTGNGRQSDTVANQGGENSDDDGAQDGGKHNSNDEVGAGTSKENGSLADVENRSSMPESDPLAESISKLDSAKEVLEKEVQNLHEIGDECWETTVEEVHEASSSRMYTLTENTKISPHYLRKHVKALKQDVDFSESKLEEANAVLKAKETRVTKLEREEIEGEIEDLFKHKLEAEFQYLTLSGALDSLKTDVIDQVPLLNELETTLNVVRDAQINVNMLKRQAEKLETRLEDTVEAEQVAKLQKRVCQVTSCLFIQLILLVLVFFSFVLHLSPHDLGVVPT